MEDKLNKLEEQFKSDGVEIPEAIKNLKREYSIVQTLLSISDTDAIKLIILEYSTDIMAINNRLLVQEEMEQIERTALFVERRFKQGFIDMFGKKQNDKLKDLEKRISDEL